MFSFMLTGFDRISNSSTTAVIANKNSIFNRIVGMLFTTYRGSINRDEGEELIEQ